MAMPSGMLCSAMAAETTAAIMRSLRARGARVQPIGRAGALRSLHTLPLMVPSRMLCRSHRVRSHRRISYTPESGSAFVEAVTRGHAHKYHAHRQATSSRGLFRRDARR